MMAFDNSEFEKYKAEAEQKWGGTDAYKEHSERTADYSKQKWDDLACEMDGIMAEFASCMKKGETPDSLEAQTLVKALQKHITENYYHCTNEILAGLGQMYVADERFRKNIDKHADGTAAAYFATGDGMCGAFHAVPDPEQFGWTIGGISIFEAFDSLPFAG